MLISLFFHSPVAFPAAVRVHLTVWRDRARYFHVRIWFVGPGFFSAGNDFSLLRLSHTLSLQLVLLPALTGSEELAI